MELRSLRLLATIALAVGVAVAMAGPSRAGTRSEDSTGRTFLFTAVERTYLSAQLAYLGCDQEDPMLLIAASRLLAWATPWPASQAPEVTGGEADVPGTHPRICVPFGPPVTEHTAQSLLADARALAGGDPHLLGVIDAVRQKNDDAIARAGNGGPDMYKLLLRRGAKATFHILFRGREPAAVAVVGTSDAKLDLVVLDGKNSVACESHAAGDHQFCTWIPAADATVSIMIENQGSWANALMLYTN